MAIAYAISGIRLNARLGEVGLHLCEVVYSHQLFVFFLSRPKPSGMSSLVGLEVE